MYIRNLKYAHLTPVLRKHNVHLKFSTCQHIQMDIVYRKTGFKREFSRFPIFTFRVKLIDSIFFLLGHSPIVKLI